MPDVYKGTEGICVMIIYDEYRIIKKGEQVGESFQCEVGQAEELQEGVNALGNPPNPVTWTTPQK